MTIQNKVNTSLPSSSSYEPQTSIINNDFEKSALSLALAVYSHLGAHVIPEFTGNVQRFPAPGKSPNNDACWLWISPGRRYAAYGSHITGETFHWNALQQDYLEPIDTITAQVEIEQSRIDGFELRLSKQEEAAERAKSIVAISEPAAPYHSYLMSKMISPQSLLQSGNELIVPMKDIHGDIQNVQRIDPDGTKRFLSGGKVKGLFAELGERYSTGTLYICEGWATAVTVHQETGHPAIAAMNAGNLSEVCTDVYLDAPDTMKFIVAADNDHRTEGNPGLTKAYEAAENIGAWVATPPLPCKHKECRCTDFNDYSNCIDRVLLDD